MISTMMILCTKKSVIKQTIATMIILYPKGARLNELASLTLELMVELDPLNSKRQKSMRLLEKQQRVEQLNARVTEEDSDADDF
jgi:hypothetical protein